MRLRIAIVSIMIGLALLSSILIASTNINTKASPEEAAILALTAHAPIYINGNSQFTNASGVSWGSGTASDPYIIEGWDISATGSAGIHIQGTTAHFIVRNCHIHGVAPYYPGIWLSNCINGVLSDNSCWNDYGGIYLISSSGNTLINNTCSSNSESGIYLGYSNGNTLSKNNCSNNKNGVYLEYSNDNNLSGGIYGSNILLSSANLGDPGVYSGITIYYSSGNTIFGNLIYNNYFGILVSVSSPDNMILDNNCSGNYGYGINLYGAGRNTVENNICSKNSFGIYLGIGSFDHTISNNICSKNSYGIYLDLFSNFDVIENNNCSNNSYGIYIYACESDTLINNSCNSNKVGGILLYSSSVDNTLSTNNALINNSCSKNIYGIYLNNSWSNAIRNSNCSNNSYGIYLCSSGEWNSIVRNRVCNNTHYGAEIASGSNNTIWDNIFIGNDGASTTYDSSRIQSRDDGTNNSWNASGSPHGLGNYWSDWTTPDANGDGIVDKPYNISGSAGAKDWYPLTSSSKIDVLDNSPPHTEISMSGTIGNNGCYISNVTVFLSATDNPGGSGILLTAYSLDGGAARDYGGAFAVATDGMHTVRYYSVDYAGNYEPVNSTTFNIDKTPPSGCISIQNGSAFVNTTSVTLNLTASDATLGIDKIRYSNDNITWSAWESFSTYRDWSLSSGDGIKTVYYQVRDNAGLNSTFADTIILDTAPPSGSISVQNGSAYANSTSVTLSPVASDATSGVAQIRLSNDGSIWSAWRTFSASESWTLPSGDGQKKVYCQIMDNAGNVATCNATIIIDTVPPVISFQQANGTYFTSGSAAINWSATDANGNVSYEYSLDGGAFISCGLTTHFDLSNLTNGWHNLTVRAVDGAGNGAERTLQFNFKSAAISIEALLPWVALVIVVMIVALLLVLRMRRRNALVITPRQHPSKSNHEEEKGEP